MPRRTGAVILAIALLAGTAVMAVAPWARGPAEVVSAAGVGGASWTPSLSTTTIELGQHLVPGDAFVVRTTARWFCRSAGAGTGFYFRLPR